VRAGRRLVAALTGITAVTGLTLLAGATPASAVGGGCPYPYVCFYPTYSDYFADHPVSRYRDVTSGWQYLRSLSVGADWITNTRNDDVAYLHFTDGSVECMVPHSVHNWNDKQVDRVRIDSSPSC
jgi:hypothetical protein